MMRQDVSSKVVRGVGGLLATGLLALGSGCESEGPSTPLKKSGSAEASRPPVEAPVDPHAGLPMPQADSGNRPLDTAGGAVALDEATFTAPAGWGRKEVGPGGFIDAEYVLPRAEGDDADGRLTISRAGGSLDANIDRWRGQFGGKPERDEKSEIEVGGMKVTLVELAGEFNDQRGPFAPASKKAGYRMFAAILPIGDTPYFVKATGPEKTIAAHADALLEFVKSVQPKKAGS